MTKMDTIYVEYDVLTAAMRLIAREAATEGEGSALKFADQLKYAHEVAGLEKDWLFWSKVYHFLMGYEVLEYPLQIIIE